MAKNTCMKIFREWKLKTEWSGRPESTLRFLKCKYGKKDMKKIAKKVLK